MRDRRSSRHAHSTSSACSMRRVVYRSSFLTHLVNRVARNHHDDFSVGILDNGLASEPRRWRQPRRPVEQVFLLLAGFAELVESLFYNHVAGRARAVPAACMLVMDSMT